ncbi:MAG: HrdC [Meiothermus sp.]
MLCESFILRIGDKSDLERLNTFLAKVMPIQVSSALVQGNPAMWSVLVFYEGPAAQVTSQTQPLSAEEPAPAPTSSNDPTFQALRTWRTAKAREEGVPPYVIATNAELEAIAARKPKTLEEFAGVKGFGKLKQEKYGRDVLEVLSKL